MADQNNINADIERWAAMHAGAPIPVAIKSLYRQILVLQNRVDSLVPTDNELDQYPALKDAYNHYRIIQKVTTGK